MIKKILFITAAALTVGVTVWFYFIQKRNGYIDYLTANRLVTLKDFSTKETGLLSAWSQHLKDLDNGISTSFATFTFNGKTYNLRTGNES